MSPPAQVLHQRYWSLLVAFKRPGWLAARPTFEVRLVRICLDCGAVLFFLGQGALQELRATERLEGVEDQTDYRPVDEGDIG